jgi:hypothetical protein
MEEKGGRGTAALLHVRRHRIDDRRFRGRPGLFRRAGITDGVEYNLLCRLDRIGQVCPNDVRQIEPRRSDAGGWNGLELFLVQEVIRRVEILHARVV